MAETKKKKRIGSIIFRIILIVIAGSTLGLGVYRLNSEKFLHDQLPTPFGFGISVIMSDSMQPVLSTNDLVVVTKQDSYDIDDIVVFQKEDLLVIHRIIEIDDDMVITKGDANPSADDPVPIKEIKAKYAFRIPYIGLIVKYIKTVPGTLLIIALALFLLYKSRQKERSKEMDELDDIVEEIKRLRENMAEKAAADDKDDDGEDSPDGSAEAAKGSADEAQTDDVKKLPTDNAAEKNSSEPVKPEGSEGEEENEQEKAQDEQKQDAPSEPEGEAEAPAAEE